MALEKYISKDEFVNLLQSDGRDSLTNKSDKGKYAELLSRFDFPTRSEEAWRYTSIKPMLNIQYALSEKIALDQKTVDLFAIPRMDSILLVFMNGHFMEQFSNLTHTDLIVCNMGSAKDKHASIVADYLDSSDMASVNLFSAMNSAFAAEGAFVYVPKKMIGSKPIQIMHLSDGNGKHVVSQNRNLIVVEEQAEAQIIHTFHSLTIGHTLNNVGTEIFVGENARLSYSVFEGEGNESFHVNHIRVVQKANSTFKSNTITLCGELVRNDLQVKLDGANCETSLAGLYLPDRNQHFDNNVNVIHNQPHCHSNQLYKGIIDDNASSVFAGKIYVDRKAQKTDAYQSNRNVLITPNAKALSKPQLEIYADDVSCTHGSTTGQLDEESLFFMQARGIGKDMARTLLLKAFVVDVIAHIDNALFKELVSHLVEKRLGGDKEANQCIKLKY